MDIDILSPEFLQMAVQAKEIALQKEHLVHETEEKMEEVKKFMMKNKAAVAELDHQAEELKKAFLSSVGEADE